MVKLFLEDAQLQHGLLKPVVLERDTRVVRERVEQP
jgi:hypothetical protein